MLYDREEPRACHIVDQWDRGLGWQVAPAETARRTSHAVRTEAGVWLLDPLDAPGLEEELATLGEVAGIAVCADYHARDAASLAERYDVPVHVPAWCRRARRKLAGTTVVTARERLGETALALRRLDPFGWNEAAVVHAPTGTLYVPDILGTAGGSTVGREEVGLMVIARLTPPREALGDLAPARLLTGHGTGIHEGAAAALRDAVENGRRRLPRALVECGPTQVRAMLGALR